jgi:hypothetical protein
LPNHELRGKKIQEPWALTPTGKAKKTSNK